MDTPHCQHRVRKYYCVNPINDACRRGFLNLAGYSSHKTTIHDPLQHVSRPQQYPFIPQVHYNDISVLSGEDGETPDLKGGYFVNHPVLDGQYYYICLFILLE
jgi:hypothetical protein